MKMFRMLCLALSQGLILGLIASAVRQTLRRRNHPDFTYTPKQLEEGRRRWKVGSRILTYVTFAMLILGFIWCLYFLVLALAAAVVATMAGCKAFRTRSSRSVSRFTSFCGMDNKRCGMDNKR